MENEAPLIDYQHVLGGYAPVSNSVQGYSQSGLYLLDAGGFET